MEDKLVYNGWLKLYNRKVEDKKYDIIKNYDAVSAIIVNEFEEILLVKQFRPSIMKDTLEIPAGCVDVEGESEIQCLIRELQEEANLKMHEKELKKVIEYNPIMGFSSSKMSIFMGKINKDRIKNTNIKDDDVKEVMWLTFEEFEKNISNREISDSKTIMSYYYLKTI